MHSCIFYSIIYFFFQAEDGIRDGHVTGVQTCALPICPGGPAARSAQRRARQRTGRHPPLAPLRPAPGLARLAPHLMEWRSEERRVGKECRARNAERHDKRRKRSDETIVIEL